MIKKKITYLLTVLVCFSCNFFKHERIPLTFEKQPFISQKLKINGYFIEEEDTLPYQTNSILLLYASGVIRNAGSFVKKTIDELEGELRKPLTERQKNITWMWGLYKVTGDSISFEQYHPGNGGYEVFVRSGIILNDSTFQVTTMRNAYSGDVVELNEIYHFRKFSPKPDSTNNIVQ